MELYQLKYLQEIARTGSLREAARQLHITQPPLSRCIKALEDEIGEPLFDRVGRNLVLNDVGKVVLLGANATLKSAESIKQSVDEFVRTREQTINLYAPVPLGNDARVLYDFKQEHPNVRLRVGVAPTDSLKYEIPDLIFFASMVDHREKRNYLHLGDEDIVLAVRPDSALANEESIALADLGSEDFISNVPNVYTTMLKSMFAQAGIDPHIVMENQSYQQIVDAVSLGFGIALVPEITWLNEQSNVKLIPLSDVHRSRHLYLKWPEGTVLSGAAEMMKDYLVDHYRKIAHQPEAADQSETADQPGTTEQAGTAEGGQEQL